MDKQLPGIQQLDDKDIIKEQPISNENPADIQQHYPVGSFGNASSDSSSEDDDEHKEFHDEHASNKILIGGIPLQHIYENSEWIKPFQCFICNNAAVSPVRCSACSTLYCYACLELWGGDKNQKQTCLKCQQSQTLDMNKDKPGAPIETQLKPDINTEIFLQEIRVDCAFKANGCTEIVTYADYENHLKTCPKRSKICLFCGDNFICDEANKHKEVCLGKTHSELLLLPDNIKNFGMDQSKLLDSLNNSRKPSGLQRGESKSTQNIGSSDKPEQFFKSTGQKSKKKSKKNSQLPQEYINDSSQLLQTSLNNSNISQEFDSAQLPQGNDSSIFDSIIRQQQQQQQHQQNHNFQGLNDNQGFQDFQNYQQKSQQIFMNSSDLNGQGQQYSSMNFQQKTEIKQPKEEHAQIQQLSNMNQINVIPQNNVVVQNKSYSEIVYAAAGIILAIIICVIIIPMQQSASSNAMQSQVNIFDNYQSNILFQIQELKTLFNQHQSQERNPHLKIEAIDQSQQESLKKILEEVADKVTQSLEKNQENQILMNKQIEDDFKDYIRRNEQQIQRIASDLEGQLKPRQSSQLDSEIDQLKVNLANLSQQNEQLVQQQAAFNQGQIKIVDAIKELERQINQNSITKSTIDVGRNTGNKDSMNNEAIRLLLEEKLNKFNLEIFAKIEQNQAQEKLRMEEIQLKYANLKLINEKQFEKVEELSERISKQLFDMNNNNNNNYQITKEEIIQTVKDESKNLIADEIRKMRQEQESRGNQSTTKTVNLVNTIKYIMNSSGISFQQLPAREDISYSGEGNDSKTNDVSQQLGCIYDTNNILSMSNSVNSLSERASQINLHAQSQVKLKFIEISSQEYVTQIQTVTENGSLVSIKISTSQGKNLFCGTYSKDKYNNSVMLPARARIDQVEQQDGNLVIKFVYQQIWQ